MADSPSLIMIQFLSWVADRPRTYAQAMDAWRTSCPRLSVWEDAVIEDLVRIDGNGAREVTLTKGGAAVLQKAQNGQRRFDVRRPDVQVCDGPYPVGIDGLKLHIVGYLPHERRRVGHALLGGRRPTGNHPAAPRCAGSVRAPTHAREAHRAASLARASPPGSRSTRPARRA